MILLLKKYFLCIWNLKQLIKIKLSMTGLPFSYSFNIIYRDPDEWFSDERLSGTNEGLMFSSGAFLTFLIY